MQHPDYAVWSFVGFILVLLPSPWHWRARNIATLSLIFWIALTNLCIFVNCIIWADNFRDSAPVWCDVSGRIIQIMGYALPACSLAQMRRLEQVASTRRTVISASERLRRMWIEGVMCLVFPPLMLPLLYVVQGHRYDIIEGVGCHVAAVISWPGIAIKLLFPIVISIATLIYSALAVRWFLVRRLQFKAILGSSQTGLTVSRYLRLIALAVTDVVILLTNDIIGLASTLQTPVQPYGSWDEVHSQWSVISMFPDGQQLPVTNFVTVIGLYAVPLYSIVFFLFFGLGEEAITEYISLWRKVTGLLEHVGLKQRSAQRPSSPPPILPSLGSKTVSASGGPLRKHDSRSDLEIYDKDEAMFQGVSPREGVMSTERGGIPILVERSVV